MDVVFSKDLTIPALALFPSWLIDKKEGYILSDKWKKMKQLVFYIYSLSEFEGGGSYVSAGFSQYSDACQLRYTASTAQVP